MLLQDKYGFYFKYDPELGKIYKSPFVNNEIVFIEHYTREIAFNGARLSVWQLAFLIMKGYIPGEIDHKDRDRTNNKWINLKDVTHSENLHNRPKQINNTSGYKGVNYRKDRGKYRYFLTIEGKTYTKCIFDSAYDAAMARDNLIIAFGRLDIPLNILNVKSS